MVVKSQDAVVAEPTVSEPRRSVDFASGAELQPQLMSPDLAINVHDILLLLELRDLELLWVVLVAVEL